MPNCSQPKFHVTNAIPWWFTSGHDEPRCVVRRDSIHPRHFWPPAHRTYPPYRHWTPTNSSAQQSQTYFFRPLIARLRWRRQRRRLGSNAQSVRGSLLSPLTPGARYSENIYYRERGLLYFLYSQSGFFCLILRHLPPPTPSKIKLSR